MTVSDDVEDVDADLDTVTDDDSDAALDADFAPVIEPEFDALTVDVVLAQYVPETVGETDCVGDDVDEPLDVRHAVDVVVGDTEMEGHADVDDDTVGENVIVNESVTDGDGDKDEAGDSLFAELDEPVKEFEIEFVAEARELSVGLAAADFVDCVLIDGDADAESVIDAEGDAVRVVDGDTVFVGDAE